MSELLKAFVSDLRQEDRKMSPGRPPAGMQPRLEWIDIDELLEVTPQHLRLRKQILPGNLRKRQS